MNFLRKIFQRRPTKMELIRKLYKIRLNNSSSAKFMGIDSSSVDLLPDEVIIGTVDATIVSIVESYVALKKVSESNQEHVLDSEILELIENHRSIMCAGIMPESLTLQTYIKYRVLLEYGSALDKISDESINLDIDEALKFFGA